MVLVVRAVLVVRFVLVVHPPELLREESVSREEFSFQSVPECLLANFSRARAAR